MTQERGIPVIDIGHISDPPAPKRPLDRIPDSALYEVAALLAIGSIAVLAFMIFW